MNIDGNNNIIKLNSGCSNATINDTGNNNRVSFSWRLHNNIRNALIDKVPTKITKTPSGLKQEYDIKLVAKDGSIKTAKVVVIVQKDNGTSVYRIITLYPGKKVK